MKRLTTTLVILFLIYFAIQIIFNKFGSGHDISYNLTDTTNIFKVQEKYISNIKDETNNYYFTITIGDTIFNLQTYANYQGGSSIIKSIKYFSNNTYKCILPVFSGDKFLFDVTCLNNNTLTPYYLLVGKDNALDAYVQTLKNIKYNPIDWQDSDMDGIIDKSLTVYSNNIINNHYVGINNYRGIYTISEENLKRIYNVKLFDYDVYKRPISGIIGKYYVTADYSQKYAFNRLFVVDLTNNIVNQITTSSSIDFDSYVQGIVDGSMYLYDRDNQKQYQITASNLNVTEVGNVTTKIKYYNNGIWSLMSAYDVTANNVVFNIIPTDTSFTGYVKVDKVGNNLSGYYYLYKKVGSTYHVYRANVQNKNLLTYIFTTNKIDNITYSDDYVYFTNNNTVKYFQDAVGVRTLLKNSEFDFNNSLYFNVYSK